MLAPNALVSVEEARAFGLSSDASQLEIHINGVSQCFENEAGRVFRVQRACESPSAPDEVPTEWYQGNNRQELHLRRSPVLAVEWVKVNGQAITDYLTKARHLLDEGRLVRTGGFWLQKAISHNPLTGDANPNFADYSIEVAYTGGYVQIPGDLKMACFEELRLCEARASSGIGYGIRSERTPGGYQATYVDPQYLLQSTRLVLARYGANYF
jgi:hypothetical protein